MPPSLNFHSDNHFKTAAIAFAFKEDCKLIHYTASRNDWKVSFQNKDNILFTELVYVTEWQ